MALLGHIPYSLLTMKKNRSQELSEKFTAQWQRSRDWLLPFMQNNQPKFLTKDELRRAAMRELNVSKSAFDFCVLCDICDDLLNSKMENITRHATLVR